MERAGSIFSSNSGPFLLTSLWRTTCTRNVSGAGTVIRILKFTPSKVSSFLQFSLPGHTTPERSLSSSPHRSPEEKIPQTLPLKASSHYETSLHHLPFSSQIRYLALQGHLFLCDFTHTLSYRQEEKYRSFLLINAFIFLSFVKMQ